MGDSKPGRPRRPRAAAANALGGAGRYLLLGRSGLGLFFGAVGLGAATYAHVVRNQAMGLRWVRDRG